jgi:phospholipid/cholesterol/gamma-HCH transport system substrate-binding protein
MITRRDRIVVGVFVLATLALLLGFLAVLWGMKASQKYKRYYVYTDSSVAGLSVSAAVKYLGVDAGRVDKMEWDNSTPPKVKITLAVFETTPVKDDTKAQLTAQGITGIQFIELIRGASDKDLPPGEEIGFLPSKLTDIVAKIDRLSGAVDLFFGENKDKLALTIDHANTFLETSTRSVATLASQVEVVLEENRASIRQLLDKARSTVDDASRIAAEVNDRRMVEELSKTLASARQAIDDLDGVVKEIHAQVANDRIGEVVADVRSASQAATRAASEAQAVLARSGGQLQDDLTEAGRTLEELKRTVGAVRQLTREVNERPALLIRDLTQPRREVRDK